MDDISEMHNYKFKTPGLPQIPRLTFRFQNSVVTARSDFSYETSMIPPENWSKKKAGSRETNRARKHGKPIFRR